MLVSRGNLFTSRNAGKSWSFVLVRLLVSRDNLITSENATNYHDLPAFPLVNKLPRLTSISTSKQITMTYQHSQSRGNLFTSRNAGKSW
jgi:hypothetical protein